MKKIANAKGVEHLNIRDERPEVARELKRTVEEMKTFNPYTSQAQKRAMYAAASGHSTLGIPKSVGKDFVAAGPASKHLPKRKSRHASK
ncbi:MAG TPA: hypothetical protein VK531_12395 [Gemmatimonadales bacterium]|nr:hypothetical protein [Gemmatimonadales bacterium]